MSAATPKGVLDATEGHELFTGRGGGIRRTFEFLVRHCDYTSQGTQPNGRARRAGWVQGAEDWIAERLGVTPKTVRAHLRALNAAGLILLWRERNRSAGIAREYVVAGLADEATLAACEARADGGFLPVVTTGSYRYLRPVVTGSDDRSTGETLSGETLSGENSSPTRPSAHGDQPSPTASGSARGERNVDLDAAEKIARKVYAAIPPRWKDDDHERRANGLAGIVAIACALERPWFDVPDEEVRAARSWAAVQDAITAPLGFHIPSGVDEFGLFATWASREQWPSLVRDVELAVLVELRENSPPIIDSSTVEEIDEHRYGDHEWEHLR